MSNINWFYDLVTRFQIVVLGPVFEEVLFRGVLLHRWAVKWNLTVALWASSLLFGINHGESFIGGTVFGLVMAILYIETGSLQRKPRTEFGQIEFGP